MYQNQSAVTRSSSSVLATNKVLKNTYLLLSITLIFSSIAAYFAIISGASQGGAMIASFGAIGLLWFVLPRTQNSAAGIPVLFGITGLLGYGLGPMLSYYLAMANGPSLIMTALGGTGIIFLGLSGYALTTKKDFSFMAGFLFVGIFVVFAAMLANIFLQIPALSLAMSAAIILLMSGFILYQTSSIIRGGETNYISAAAGLFISILNLFTSLLHLLGALGGDD